MTPRDLGAPPLASSERSSATNHVLAIAIDRYTTHRHLHNAVKDARDIVRILTTSFAFDAANVRELYDEAATLIAITTALDELARRLGPDSNLILYFAGHGVREHNGAWIPIDAVHFSGYLKYSALRDYLAAIPARHVFVIVDSCFSGALAVTRSSSSTPTSTAAERLERLSSRYVLTAGRDERVLDGVPGANSPFAESLKFHLATGPSRMSMVSLSESVLEQVTQRPGTTQSPAHGCLDIPGNQDGRFYFERRDNAPAREVDAFVRPYFARNRVLIPPARRREVLAHFDEYDAYFATLTGDARRDLQRANTLAYLAK